ncbi:MAG: FAD-dependent oxidoreductase, partial [Candidatus Poseidoniia archaeon]
TNVWGSETYNVLKVISRFPQTGVSMTQTYEYFREEQPDPSWKQSVDGFKRLNGNLPEDYIECFSFITPVIEMPIYLKWLMNRYEELGGKQKVKKVDNFSNITDKYDLVVNCTGLESKNLLNDSEVYPVRGQIIRVKTDIKEMYLDQQISTLAYIVPRSEDMILGGVAQNNDWSLETRIEDREDILEKCCKLIPELRNAEIIEDMVGLRPGRSEVRLEKEILLGRPMIHNYGHGGSGVTLSWGCADDVVELANES